MKSLISIISKNFKVIARSKLSTFMVLLAPILIVFLVGTAFNSSSLHNLKLGVYSDKYNTLTDSIISDLEAKQFVSEKMDSRETCMNAVKNGEVHVCVIFPADISVTGNNESIIVYTDNSRINIAYMLTSEINSIVANRGSSLGVVMVQSLLDALNNAKSSLSSQKNDVSAALTSVGNISNNENQVTGNIDSLQDKLDELSTVVNKVVKEMNSSGNSNSLKNQLASLQSDLDVLDDQIYSGLNGIDSSSKDTQIKLAKVSSDLDILSSKINALKITNAQDVVLPIRTEVMPLTEDSTNWKYLFPTLVALITLLSSIVLSSDMVLAERKARAHFRNFMTPTSDVAFIMGTYISCLTIIGIQLLILFLGTIYITSISISHVLPQLILVLLLASSSFIFLGMFIGYLFKSDETTVLASISIASLLIFFSNAILPTEIINGNLKYLAIYNPFYAADMLLRKIILFNSPIAALGWQTAILVGSFIVLFLITLVARKMTKRLL